MRVLEVEAYEISKELSCIYPITINLYHLDEFNELIKAYANTRIKDSISIYHATHELLSLLVIRSRNWFRNERNTHLRFELRDGKTPSSEVRIWHRSPCYDELWLFDQKVHRLNGPAWSERFSADDELIRESWGLYNMCVPGFQDVLDDNSTIDQYCKKYPECLWVMVELVKRSKIQIATPLAENIHLML